ncbi:hypothetical protein AcW1_002185 [Taiwanofungus camphoratus]|nr:hypothetical protein AcW1_002185 [Antrodia cinnamomea]
MHLCSTECSVLDPDTIVEFLRLNPMVATFDWAEILAECDDSPPSLQHPSMARARLHAHTIFRMITWGRFHEDRQLDPAMTDPLGHRFWEFTEWYDAESKASALFERWTQAA